MKETAKEASEIWKESPDSVKPQPVSKDFIEGLRAAGARDSLIQALERQHKTKSTND